MALSAKSLEEKAVTNLKAEGFNPDGEHAWARKFIRAISKAVVDEITSNAEVPVTGGSSAGKYKVK